MRKVQFANDHYYHIYNRGVDKRKIFLENRHYYRFIHDLYEFNDKNAAINVKRYFERRLMDSRNPSVSRVCIDGFRESISPANVKNKRNLLVEIICFIREWLELVNVMY